MSTGMASVAMVLTLQPLSVKAVGGEDDPEEDGSGKEPVLDSKVEWRLTQSGALTSDQADFTMPPDNQLGESFIPEVAVGGALPDGVPKVLQDLLIERLKADLTTVIRVHSKLSADASPVPLLIGQSGLTQLNLPQVCDKDQLQVSSFKAQATVHASGFAADQFTSPPSSRRGNRECPNKN